MSRSIRKPEPIGRLALVYAVALLLSPVGHGLLSVFVLQKQVLGVVVGVCVATAVYAALAVGSMWRMRRNPQAYAAARDVYVGWVLVLFFAGFYLWVVARWGCPGSR